MRRLGTFWLVCALALVTAVFAASAFAGGDEGHGGNGGGGQDSAQQQGGGDQHGGSGQDQASHQSSDQKHSDQTQSGQTPSNDHGSAKSSGNDSGNGVKPSSTTSHWTTTKVGDQPDVSKRYGNGKTAAEIAKSHGAPDSTVLVGPGNSQPHKVVSCKHPHGVDVHAVKSYSTEDCNAVKVEEQKPAEQPKVETPKPVEAKVLGTDHKVTLCHLTGNGTYVAITVDKHSLKEGHTAAKGDIIPMPAGGCGAVAAVQTELGKACASGEVKGDDDESDNDHGGQQGDVQGEHQDNQASESSEDNDADEANECATESTGAAAAGQSPTISVQAPAVVTPTVTAAASATVTTTVPAAVITTTTTPASAAVVAANAQPATPAQGGVLGATANLAAPKPASGGVLGAVGNIAGASLPFTGFPVWLALLVALALVALGIVLRRGGGTTSRL
jgi:hypothetical protein